MKKYFLLSDDLILLELFDFDDKSKEDGLNYYFKAEFIDF